LNDARETAATLGFQDDVFGLEEELKEDCVDVQLDDITRRDEKDLLSDPTHDAFRSLRKDRKRNYKDMLDGNEAFKKSKMDEEIEIRQKLSIKDLHHEAFAQF